MKVTVQSGVGNPVHNSRNYDLEKSVHVDASRTSLNKYLSIYKDIPDNFVEVEKRFYAENFKDWLEVIKESAIQSRHKERIKTSEKLRKGTKTKPQEILYQIGDRNEAPTPKEFRKWVNDVLAYHHKITKGYGKVLNVAIHHDEETPHAHVRQVWVYKEKSDGEKEYLRIGKEKALEAAGIPLPNPDEPVGRYNNRAVTYTRLMREYAEARAQEMGFDIDTTRSSRKHMEKDDYIAWKKAQESERHISQSDKKEVVADELEGFIQDDGLR